MDRGTHRYSEHPAAAVTHRPGDSCGGVSQSASRPSTSTPGGGLSSQARYARQLSRLIP